MLYTSREGTFALELEGRSGTPVLAVPNLVNGNIVQVTTNFMGSAGNGFYYTIQPTSDEFVEALTPTWGVFQGVAGWAACTRFTLFRIQNIPPQDPIEEVDFEVFFSARDLGGPGRLNNFFLSARVVSNLQ